MPYRLPTTGEIVPLLQIVPSKTTRSSSSSSVRSDPALAHTGPFGSPGVAPSRVSYPLEPFIPSCVTYVDLGLNNCSQQYTNLRDQKVTTQGPVGESAGVIGSEPDGGWIA